MVSLTLGPRLEPAGAWVKMGRTAPLARAAMPHPRRLLTGLLALAAALALLVAAGVGVLAAIGGLVLPERAVALVERRADPQGRLAIGGLALAWDDALALHATDARLRARDGGDALRLGALSVELDWSEALRGRVRPTAVTLDAPSLRVARDADGRVGLGLGVGGPPPFATVAEAEAALDALLARPELAALERIALSDVAVEWDDAMTGRSERLEGGTIALTRRDGLRLDGTLPLRGGALTLSATRGATTEATVTLDALPAARLAEWVPALDVLRGTVSATLDASTAPGAPVSARVEIAEGGVTDDPALAFRRAAFAADWVPGGAVTLSEIALDAPGARATATGQVLPGATASDPLVVQLDLRDVVLDPAAIMDAPARFDRGGLSARLHPRTRRVEVGQAWLSGPSGTARLSGDVALEPAGPRGTVRARVPRMAIADLLALWPEAMAPRARRWLAENIRAGTATEAAGAARLVPGARPAVGASFAIADATVRYMRHMPVATQARGFAELAGDRFAIRVDAATVTPEGGGPVDVAGTRLVIPDIAARPAVMEVDLQVAGRIPDVLRGMDNPPFDLLARLGRGPDLATGTGTLSVRVAVPLRDRLAAAEVDWSVAGVLRSVASDTLVPGRRLSADTLSLVVDPSSVRIAGEAALDGVAARARYEQPLPPPRTEWIDPAGPRPPPQAVPPGTVRGTARVDGGDLAALGLAIPGLETGGTAEGAFTVTLGAGGPPVLAVEADLSDASAALPVIGWSKPRGAAASLSLEARLADAPVIERVALDAPGLSGRGSVTLRPGGGLAVARLDVVDAGWFSGPVTLTGRGRGALPAVAVGGGRADLLPALRALGGEGEGGGASAPVTIRLDTLRLSDGIAFRNLSADLEAGRGVEGRFRASLNGRADVAGRMVPDRGGTAVRIETADMGAVLRAADLVAGARGGAARLILRPGGGGAYEGTLRGTDLTVRDAPALASLLQALSGVGLLEQLATGGLVFAEVEAEFDLEGRLLTLRRGAAVGPSMSITAEGRIDTVGKVMDVEGVVSPIFFVNGLLGALTARRDEGLFGFTYRLAGPFAGPQVAVNPLSILTPGVFREIFRRPPPGG